ncbi:ArsR/SmtB family transcription factor [Dactylosporangium sp. NPDC051541]|uniref:ArsR/SmtB family transcription factor n=1 Tax=Dactylosporangium sp. NPDC051541 TaxID=3363977 RepID=UPI0037918ABA
MIRIELSTATLAAARIAISPITELIGALELLHRYGGGAVPWPYTQWAERARGVLAARSPDAPLRVYGRLLDVRARQRTPDLFHPMAAGPAPELGEELELLRRTPAETVDAQLAVHHPDAVPEWLWEYQRNPVVAFAALADDLAAFWDEAMLGVWPRMAGALDEEVQLRARAIATGGAATLLGGLAGVARWEPPVLSLPKTKESFMGTAGRRLLLVPALFADRKVACSTDNPEVLRLTYQCRGAAVLAPGPDRAPATDRLGLMLGERRAQVLRALTVPATTSGLVAGLGLPASTVSEQLTALHAAGVLHRRRVGRRVFYGLEPAGHTLLELFDSVAANQFHPQ